jgi:hypothetical protein
VHDPDYLVRYRCYMLKFTAVLAQRPCLCGLLPKVTEDSKEI